MDSLCSCVFTNNVTAILVYHRVCVLETFDHSYFRLQSLRDGSDTVQEGLVFML